MQALIKKKYIYIYIYIYFIKKEHKLMTEKKEKKKKKKQWKIHIEQTKSTIAFTHLPNKCHDIFTKHLFSVVVGHRFIFYYFISTYKKLTP